MLNTDFGDAPESYKDAGALLQPRWTEGEIPKGTATNLAAIEDARVGPAVGFPWWAIGLVAAIAFAVWQAWPRRRRTAVEAPA